MTLREWLINKVQAVPLQFSLRHQCCYFAVEIDAPNNFNSFNKYFQKYIRGKKIPYDRIVALQEGVVSVNTLTFGSVKQIDNLIRITVWTNATHFILETT